MLLLEDNFRGARFQKGPVIFPVRKQIFKSKPVEFYQFLAHKPFNFASLTDSFLLSFLKSLKLLSWMLTRQPKTAFRAWKLTGTFEERVPEPLSISEVT